MFVQKEQNNCRALDGTARIEPGDMDSHHSRRSAAALLLSSAERSGGGAVDDVAVRGVEAGAVTGTVPRALERVEADHAAEVRTDGRVAVQRAVFVAVDRRE